MASNDPTRSWSCFGNLDRESSLAKCIEELLLILNVEFLCNQALEIRSSIDEKSPNSCTDPLTCSIDVGKFTHGYYNVVLAIEFSDAQYWIARIRLPTSPSTDSEVEAAMLSEISTIRLLKSRTSIPIPQVHAFDVGRINPLGFRYMLMQALPGFCMDEGFSKAVPQEHMEKFTNQLANYYYQLSTLKFESIGRLTSGPEMNQETCIDTSLS